MDRVLLREVEEIADRVRELEKSVPCQVDIINDDYGRNVGQDPLGVIQDGPRSASGNNICGRASSVGVTMNNTNVMVHGDEHQQQRAGDGADPQPSERLIIKLDSNKSGGGDAERALPPPPPSCPVAIMDGEEEIKALVKELKRKIEYTERMNWLCKYMLTRTLTNHHHHLLGRDRTAITHFTGKAPSSGATKWVTVECCS